MYTHSNELEEAGLISLHGANLECDTQKELLLGVSVHQSHLRWVYAQGLAEKVLFYTLYYRKLARICRTLVKGVTIMDFKT